MQLKEVIIKAEQCAGLLVDDLKDLRRAAGGNRALELVVMELIGSAVKINTQLKYLEVE